MLTNDCFYIYIIIFFLYVFSEEEDEIVDCDGCGVSVHEGKPISASFKL